MKAFWLPPDGHEQFLFNQHPFPTDLFEQHLNQISDLIDFLFFFVYLTCTFYLILFVEPPI